MVGSSTGPSAKHVDQTYLDQLSEDQVVLVNKFVQGLLEDTLDPVVLETVDTLEEVPFISVEKVSSETVKLLIPKTSGQTQSEDDK